MDILVPLVFPSGAPYFYKGSALSPSLLGLYALRLLQPLCYGSGSSSFEKINKSGDTPPHPTPLVRGVVGSTSLLSSKERSMVHFGPIVFLQLPARLNLALSATTVFRAELLTLMLDSVQVGSSLLTQVS